MLSVGNHFSIFCGIYARHRLTTRNVAFPARVAFAMASTQSEGSKPTPPKSDGKQEKAPAEPQFTELSRGLLIHRPDIHSKEKSKLPVAAEVAPPRIILIFGWMDAPARIVTKYANPWIERFPQATVILRLSSAASYMAGKDAKDLMMKRLVNLVKEEGHKEERRHSLHTEIGRVQLESDRFSMDKNKQNEVASKKDPGDSTVTLIEKSTESIRASSPAEAPPSGIIIHSFSDGGNGTLASFIELLSSKKIPVPTPRAHIIDSSPGIGTAYSASTAMSMAYKHRSKLVYWAIRIAVYLFTRTLLFVKRITGSPTRSDLLRRTLNNPEMWQWKGQVGGPGPKEGKTVPRLYLFSKADRLIDHKAVESHARDFARVHHLDEPQTIAMDPAKRAPGEKTGMPEMAKSPLQLRRWENGPHCDLGRHDFEGYWSSIDAFLENHAKDPVV